jgi:hypothetical protein
VYRGVKSIHPEDMVQAEGAMKWNPTKRPIGQVLSKSGQKFCMKRCNPLHRPLVSQEHIRRPSTNYFDDIWRHACHQQFRGPSNPEGVTGHCWKSVLYPNTIALLKEFVLSQTALPILRDVMGRAWLGLKALAWAEACRFFLTDTDYYKPQYILLYSRLVITLLCISIKFKLQN